MSQLPRDIPYKGPLASWWFQTLTCVVHRQLGYRQINYAKVSLLYVTVILAPKCPCGYVNWWVFSGGASMSSTSRGAVCSAGSKSEYTANFGLRLTCCRSEKHFACQTPIKYLKFSNILDLLNSLSAFLLWWEILLCKNCLLAFFAWFLFSFDTKFFPEKGNH